MKNTRIKVGIGFVTGRRGFRQTVRAYAENWAESGLVGSDQYKLDMFVAYDLKYQKTKPEDFINLDRRIVEKIGYPYFIGEETIRSEMADLVRSGVLTLKEAALLFGEGYAKKRNVIVYYALKNGIDYLLFLDDDEYPMAVLNRKDGLSWKGQSVLSTHLDYIDRADITYGYHCGYVSPIPYMNYNSVLTEADFRSFIETISNDIVSWDTLQKKLKDGGVTYASERVVENRYIEIVREIDGAKFISGSNLCLNLRHPERLFPFYNPPGARGEDTFLSTCLSDRQVLKVPCYTFHDGFSAYQQLLCGSLPEKLRPVAPESKEIVERFLKACIGWNRYKPLLTYIVNRQSYDDVIAGMKENLMRVLPKVSRYFGSGEFMKMGDELDFYSENAGLHYELFEETKAAWRKIADYLENESGDLITRTN